jgi:hypothetical protein
VDVNWQKWNASHSGVAAFGGPDGVDPAIGRLAAFSFKSIGFWPLVPLGRVWRDNLPRDKWYRTQLFDRRTEGIA